jgi:hypothetical protein
MTKPKLVSKENFKLPEKPSIIIPEDPINIGTLIKDIPKIKKLSFIVNTGIVLILIGGCVIMYRIYLSRHLNGLTVINNVEEFLYGIPDFNTEENRNYIKQLEILNNQEKVEYVPYNITTNTTTEFSNF